MSRVTTVRLIAWREVHERTRSRIFRIGTFMTVLIVVAAIVLPALVSGGQAPPSAVIAVVEPAPVELQKSLRDLQAPLGVELALTTVPDLVVGEESLRTGVAQVLVVPGREVVTAVGPDPFVGSPVARVAGQVADVAKTFATLESQGLSPADIATVLDDQPLPVRGLTPPPVRNSVDAASSTTGMILLFVFLTLYGAFILNGVIEEKTSRVVEILLSSVRPTDLLLGKVIGIGLVGSIQGIVLVTATVAARAAVPDGGSDTLTTPVVLYTMLWFVLGFGIFAWLYACAGALVSRSEDAQNLVFPLQIPLVASYGVGLYSAFNGPNTALTVMSFIPFTAPMTMLERMAAQQVQWWEVAISIGLCLITTYLVMRIAVTIFAGGILRSGQRVKLREAWRSL